MGRHRHSFPSSSSSSSSSSRSTPPPPAAARLRCRHSCHQPCRVVGGDVAFTSTLDPRSRRKHERAVQCHPHCTDWCEVHLYEEEDCKRLAKERLTQLAVRAALTTPLPPLGADPAPQLVTALLGVLQLVLPSHADVASLTPALLAALRIPTPASPAASSAGSLSPHLPRTSPSFTLPPPHPPLLTSPPPPARSILTRNAGKRKRPPQPPRSHGTTYMSSDDFLSYFARSRSLSEAVKWIVRDYPSYREVSIYARARRLECKFDAKGRFYQPSAKRARKGSGRSERSEEEGEGGDDSDDEEDDSGDGKERGTTSEGEDSDVDDAAGKQRRVDSSDASDSSSSASSSTSSSTSSASSVSSVGSSGSLPSLPPTRDTTAMSLLVFAAESTTTTATPPADPVTTPAPPMKVELHTPTGVVTEPSQLPLLPLSASAAPAEGGVQPHTASSTLSPHMDALALSTAATTPSPLPRSSVPVLRPTASPPASIPRPSTPRLLAVHPHPLPYAHSHPHPHPSHSGDAWRMPMGQPPPFPHYHPLPPFATPTAMYAAHSLSSNSPHSSPQPLLMQPQVGPYYAPMYSHAAVNVRVPFSHA